MERTPQNLVLDASAAAKWFLQEENTQEAVRLRDAHIEGTISLAAPDLLIYEVANALNFHPKTTVSDLKANLTELFELDLDLVAPSTEYSSQIIESAKKLSITVYDASYVALSETMATSLVTADNKLYQKILKAGRAYLLSELEHTWILPK